MDLIRDSGYASDKSIASVKGVVLRLIVTLVGWVMIRLFRIRCGSHGLRDTVYEADRDNVFIFNVRLYMSLSLAEYLRVGSRIVKGEDPMLVVKSVTRQAKEELFEIGDENDEKYDERGDLR
jgi:hypothetical protein